MSTRWIYQTQTGGFFHDINSLVYDPMSATTYQPEGSGQPLSVMGCRDGYIREFDDTAEDDDGSAFTSFVFYGPIMLGGSGYGFGVLHELVVTLDTASNDVTVGIRTGNSPQEAIGSANKYTTTCEAGRNRNRYPRLTGSVAYVIVSGTGTKWAIDSLHVTIEPRGRQRIP
jgi:hypothetical protein